MKIQKEWEYVKIPSVEDNDFQSEKRLSFVMLKAFLKRCGRDVKHCEKCGRRRNKKRSLTVHHKDGNPLNNRPENLQVLCRECHDVEEKLV